MKSLLFAVVIVGATFIVGRAFADESTAPQRGGEPLVMTSTPAPTATVLPMATLAHGSPTRVQFAVGNYGATVPVNGRQTFVLWAAGGQVFRVVVTDGMSARLTAPSGAEVGFGQPIPDSGDYLLTVDGTDQLNVEIR